MDIKNSAFSALKFVCESCNIKCSKKNDWDRHILTRKHLTRVNGNQMEIKFTQKSFTCKCGKKYANNSGLWKHSKNCHISELEEETITPHMLDSSSSEIKALTNLVLEMVKSNTELQKQQNELQKQNNDLHKQVLDVCKHNNTTNNIHTNSHNKTFNLQFFLNEQCKDAMNISDFANSFDLQLSDLESVGELGYVEGITKLFVDKLNSMDIYKRPIHCSDAKREILYVKDDNKWEREERNNPKLRYAIKTISFRNMKLAALWSDTYPESKDCDSHLNETYMKLIKESTGGNGEIADNENKIIRRIAKEIIIEK
jgi:predicted transcriptional regulator